MSDDKKKPEADESMLEAFDEESGSVELPSDDALSSVQDLARRQISLEDEVAEIEETLKQKKKDLESVSMTDIPEALKELGLANFELDSGEKVKVEEKLKASIPAGATEDAAERARRAYKWLEDNGSGALIKDQIVFKFGASKREKELAATVRVLMSALQIPFEDSRSVHTGTLGKFCRERIEEGLDLDRDVLGVHEYAQTKITRPKAKK